MNPVKYLPTHGRNTLSPHSREEYWKHNGYTSHNCSLETSSDEEEGEGEGEEEERQINYVVGDVTQPQNTGSNDAIIIHCVGEVLLSPVFRAVGCIMHQTVILCVGCR